MFPVSFSLWLSVWLQSVLILFQASLVAQAVKNLPAMQETRVQSLGWEDPLEKGMATHSSILPWRISWTEEPGRLQFIGLQGVGHDWATNTFTFRFQEMLKEGPISKLQSRSLLTSKGKPNGPFCLGVFDFGTVKWLQSHLFHKALQYSPSHRCFCLLYLFMKVLLYW